MNKYLEIFSSIMPYDALDDRRMVLTKKYAWAIPNDTALSAIRSQTPLIEIGAGKGYWASLLDVDIICYDIAPDGNRWCDPGYYYPVAKGGPEQILAHPDRTLMLCWPPYNNSMASECLKVYTGNVLIYIGEGGGGCTGDSDFWNLIQESWEEEDYLVLPQWCGLHDGLYIFKRGA